MTIISRRILISLLAAPALFSAACSISGTEPIASASVETTTFAPALGVDLSAMTRTASGVYMRDLVIGTGAVVTSGQQISVRYSGWLANGTLFDTVQPSSPPATFRIGVGQVIAGWDAGVPGMRVGGKRQLVIPPSQGYGAFGSGPIPGNAVLVFSIDMVSAQ